MATHFNGMSTAELSDIWKSNDRSAWSDTAFQVIETTLRARGVDPGLQDIERNEAEDNLQIERRSFGAEIARLWRGEEGLANSYWITGVCGTGLFKGALYLTQAFLLSTTIIMILAALYSLFVSVAIWRSAGRYHGRRAWAVLARVAVVTSLGWLALDLCLLGAALTRVP